MHYLIQLLMLTALYLNCLRHLVLHLWPTTLHYWHCCTFKVLGRVIATRQTRGRRRRGEKKEKEKKDGSMCIIILFLASETLYKGNELRIGDLHICLDVCMTFLHFDPRVFVLPTLSQTSLNRILWFIDFYLYHPRKLNCLPLWILLWVQLKLTNLRGSIFYSN